MPPWIPALLFLLGCPNPSPDGTVELPVDVGHAIEVNWTSNGGEREVWLDIDLDGARGLWGPIRVLADGRELESGEFSSAHKGIDGHGHLVHNWSSTPWGVKGQIHLWDLPAVPAGTAMSATLDLRANRDATVRRVTLQIRPPGLF